MEFKDYHPSEQVYPSEDAGLVPPPLPEIIFFEDFAANPPVAPPQAIDGFLHQGCKMVLGGSSKTNKSWCLLDLAMSVASGQPWWGRPCTSMPVVYINFELQPWALAQRLNALCGARPECKLGGHKLALWNLRGRNSDLTLLRPKLESALEKHSFGLIILDPIYKVLGNRDENANGEIADLMNEIEAMCQKTGAAIVIAHHFAKGDATSKSAIDRMSGAGTWGRDPDSLLVLTQHEEPDCFTVSPILRNMPPVPEFVVSWEFPLMRVASDLDPDSLRRPQSKNKVCTDHVFVEKLLQSGPKGFSALIKDAKELLGMERRTVAKYLKRLTDNGLISHSGDLYYAKETP